MCKSLDIGGEAPSLELLQNSLAARLAKYLKKNPERLAPLIEDS